MSVDFEACDDCGDVMLDERLVNTGDGYSYCASCFNGSDCIECGEPFRHIDMILCEDNEEAYICKFCHEGHINTCLPCALLLLAETQTELENLKQSVDKQRDIIKKEIIEKIGNL